MPWSVLKTESQENNINHEKQESSSPPVFYDSMRTAKLSFIGAVTCHYCVIAREQSDRGNLNVQRTIMSYR